MTTNEIKKALYTEKPDAIMDYINNGNVYYSTKLSDSTEVFFKVPAEETSGAYFYNTMPAAHLIRWIWEEVVA